MIHCRDVGTYEDTKKCLHKVLRIFISFQGKIVFENQIKFVQLSGVFNKFENVPTSLYIVKNQ